jgi:TonB family protein
MTTIIDNSIASARNQELQKLPKILACGVGGSLLFHGIAAAVFNFLPKQSDNPVEVTFIDKNDLPKEFQPTPTPTPVVKVTPTPTPIPVVKVTPIPTPTPVVKVTPTPTLTPVVKVTPIPTPQEVKIVTRSDRPMLPISEPKTPQKLAQDRRQSSSMERSYANNRLRQRRSAPTNAQQGQSARKKPIDESGVSGLNNDALERGQSSQFAKTFSTLFQIPRRSGDDRTSDGGNAPDSPGGSSGSGLTGTFNGGSNSGSLARKGNGGSGISSGIALSRNPYESGDEKTGGGNDSPGDFSPGSSGSGLGGAYGGNNSGSLASNGGGSSNWGSKRSTAGIGDSNDDGFMATYIPGGSNGRGSSGGNALGNGGGNGSALSSGGSRSNKPGNGFGSGDGIGSSGGDGDFASTYSPGGGNGRGSSGGNGLGNGGGNGSALSSGGSRTSKPGNGFGTGDGMGNSGGDGFAGGEPGANNSSGGRGSLVATSKGFGTGLECLVNCQPDNPHEVERNLSVKVNITLDNSGKVISSSLSKPSSSRELNNFAEVEFSKMQFKIPPNFPRRKFIVTMSFTVRR